MNYFKNSDVVANSSVQCRRLLQARECFCSRKRHVETPTDREKLGESKEAGQRGRVVVNKQLSPAQNTPAMQAIMSIATSAFRNWRPFFERPGGKC